MTKIPHLRWWIAGAIFVASVLNYVDRQTLSLLAPTIQADLKLTDQDYAAVVNWFLVAYTVSLVLSGRLVDRIGVRWSLALFVGWWSVANILTSFARSAASLGAFRFMLGLGEAGNWTAAPKAVSTWFPPRERGIAIGVYTLGGTIGATIAPVLVAALAARFGWQGTFVITGAAGLVWLVPWLWLYRSPEAHPRLSEAERAILPAPEAVQIQEEPPVPWLSLLGRGEVWRLMFGRMLTDPVFFFYQFWFAKYLHDERGLSQTGLAITWVIFLAADVGALGGGWFSGRLIQRGQTPPASRVRVMATAAALVPVSLFVPGVSPLWGVLACGMIVVFAHMIWLVNIGALIVDVIPRRSLGATFGLVAAGSSLGGIAMNWAVGRLVAEHSYAPAFMVMACAHPIALMFVWGLRKKVAAGEVEPSSPTTHV